MRFLLSLLGVGAAAILLFVSAAMNWRFGFSLGRTELDAQIYGAASAAADGLKALLPFFVMWALRQKNYGQVLSGALLWIVCAAYSLTSSLGFAALNRAEMVGERELQAGVYQDLRAELSREQEKLGWVPQHRSIGEVNADLKAALATPIIYKRKQHGTLMSVSENCTKTNWLTRKGCDQVLNLRKELAVSQQAQKLETRIADLKTQIAGISSQANSGLVNGQIDPQADLLSKLTGINTKDIQLGLVILVSMLVELGSGLGLFVAFSHMTISGHGTLPVDAHGRSLQVVRPKRHRRRLISRSDVERYYSAHVIQAEGESITTTEMHEDYKLWCERKGREPLALTVFNRKVSELGVRKTRIGGRMRYVDVQLKMPQISESVDAEFVEELQAVKNSETSENEDPSKRPAHAHYAVG